MFVSFSLRAVASVKFFSFQLDWFFFLLLGDCLISLFRESKWSRTEKVTKEQNVSTWGFSLPYFMAIVYYVLNSLQRVILIAFSRNPTDFRTFVNSDHIFTFWRLFGFTLLVHCVTYLLFSLARVLIFWRISWKIDKIYIYI